MKINKATNLNVLPAFTGIRKSNNDQNDRSESQSYQKIPVLALRANFMVSFKGADKSLIEECRQKHNAAQADLQITTKVLEIIDRGTALTDDDISDLAEMMESRKPFVDQSQQSILPDICINGIVKAGAAEEQLGQFISRADLKLGISYQSIKSGLADKNLEGIRTEISEYDDFYRFRSDFAGLAVDVLGKNKADEANIDKLVELSTRSLRFIDLDIPDMSIKLVERVGIQDDVVKGLMSRFKELNHMGIGLLQAFAGVDQVDPLIKIMLENKKPPSREEILAEYPEFEYDEKANYINSIGHNALSIIEAIAKRHPEQTYEKVEKEWTEGTSHKRDYGRITGEMLNNLFGLDRING